MFWDLTCQCQDLKRRYDWPVKKAIVDLPIGMKENSKCTSSNSLSPAGAQNKDISAALQTLLTELKLCLRRRLDPISSLTKPTVYEEGPEGVKWELGLAGFLPWENGI